MKYFAGTSRSLSALSIRESLISLSMVVMVGVVLGILFAGPIEAEVRLIPMESGEVQAMREAISRVPVPQPLNQPGTILLLPYYEVDSDPSGRSTLIGVRNVAQFVSTTADISYYDVSGNLVATEIGITIPASGVYTRNLQHVAGIPAGADGIKRGFAYVAAATAVSGEYFQIDPANAFATGNRLVANGERCFIADIRFLQGGGFSGGTHYQLFVDAPLGVQPADPPTASFTVSAENGTIFGTVGIQTDQAVSEFTIGDVLSALPGGIGPAFGSSLVVISASAGYGLLQATFSALGQYSVGVPASCQVQAP